MTMKFTGFVENYGEESAILKFWNGDVEFRRSFRVPFLTSFGIREEGQLVELEITITGGKTMIAMRTTVDTGDPQCFQIVDGLDYVQFGELEIEQRKGGSE